MKTHSLSLQAPSDAKPEFTKSINTNSNSHWDAETSQANHEFTFNSLHLCSAGPLPIRAAAPSYNAEAHHQLQTNSLITHKQPKLLIFTRSPLHEFDDQRQPWEVLKVERQRDGRKNDLARFELSKTKRASEDASAWWGTLSQNGYGNYMLAMDI